MAGNFDRRAFLGTGLKLGAGAVILGGAGGFLAACSSDSDSNTSTTGAGGAASFGALDYQLSWIKNVEFAGQYIADTNGYYKDAGFDPVNLMSGGPTVQQDSVVAAGGAFVGVSAPDILAAGILNGGLPLIAGAALFQRNPFAVLSMADNPIPTPQDMVGKKIGVQSVNEPVWTAFLKANDLDPASITTVPVQFDPTPLTVGEVDGWFSFFTNEPNTLRMQGFEVEVFLLDDYNYPLVSQIYVFTKETYESKAEQIKAFYKAEIMGWHASIADPALGAKLAATVYGKDLGLDEEEQVLESIDQNTLIVTEETLENGILTISDAKIEQSIATLALGGIEIAADQLFDTTLLEEMYSENPDLRTVPEPATTVTTA